MSRKELDELSLKAREQYIIDAVIKLIDKHGVNYITMDKIVAAVPYSKGTVYKYFIGKEDLFLAIGNYALTNILYLVLRAINYQGGTRERMMLTNISYLIYAIINPSLFNILQCSKSPTVYGKSSEVRVKEHEQLELKLMETIFDIIEEAVISQQLVLPKHMNIQQVCFTIWRATYGSISLFPSKVELSGSVKTLVLERELFNQNNIIFDGLQWGPLTKDKNYKQALESALIIVFPEELSLIKSIDRVFNFS